MDIHIKDVDKLNFSHYIPIQMCSKEAQQLKLRSGILSEP